MALKEARNELGISQEELAFRADINRTYISHIERGAKNIAVDNMERLAEAVGKPLWTMLRRESERP
jgi:transcriptional regulator with XRE-family HTH domain